jgi:hypothetical protein
LPTRTTIKALAATAALALAFSGLTVATAAAPAFADGAGQPFSCAAPTFFNLSENPVGTGQLYKGTYAANGTASFTALGGTKTGTSLYNAMAYNPQDGYIYAAAYGSSNTGHILRVDSAGNTTDIGATSPALGAPTATLWDSGEFDAAGNFYVFNGNSGTTKMYKISGLAGAPATAPTSTLITLSASVAAADVTMANGFLWARGYANGNFYRINPANGSVSAYASTVIPNLDYGSAFTMGNGNLAFISTTGKLEQVAVANPTTTPTFSLVSAETAPTNQRSDATNCVTRPTDLSISMVGTQAVLVNGTITWTLDVHNAGPGLSSGFVVNDTLPTTIPTTTAPTASSTAAGCTVSGRAIACNGAGLAVGADAVITITAKASPTSLADVVNTATVTANEQDLVPSNNSASYTTKVGPQPIAAVNDTASTAAVTPVNVNVLANDTYTGGGVTAVSTPGHGTASISSDGTVKYTPAAKFSGTDTFTYTLTDVEGQTKTGTVTVTVTPVAVNDAASTTVGTAVDVDVLANDQGTGLSLTSASGATNGSVSVVGGKAHFVPASGYSGTATFGYTMSANGGSSSATATVSISPTPGNDALSTTAGVAVTDTNALANDAGTGLSIIAVGNGANGTASLSSGLPVYTPAAGFSGTDTFTYTVADSSGLKGTATVTVTVAPTAIPDAAVTPANTASSVPVLTNDLGKSLTVTSVTQPSHGSVAIVAGLPVYTPSTGYSGPDSFSYTATGAGGSSTSTVAMTVNPVAVTDTASVEAGDDVSIDALANDAGTNLTLTSAANGAHGTVAIVAGKLVYSSVAGYAGTDTFSYTITDAYGHTSTVGETVTVTPDPSGVNDTASTIAGGPVTIDVTANDNGSALSLQSVTNGTQGTATVVAGKAVYTPGANFSGTDTFSYTAKDAKGHSYTASVTVTVGPKAEDDAVSTVAGVPVSIDVTSNDLGSDLQVIAAGSATHGSVVVTNGTVTFAPASGYSGAASFSYTITDGSNQSSSANVAVTVLPAAAADSATTVAGTSVTVDVLANDVGTSPTITGFGDGAHGSVTAVGTRLSYTPNDGFSGSDSFTYSIEDADGGAATAAVTVTVTPVASDDTATTAVNVPVDLDVAANDTGSSLALTTVGSPINGSVAIVGGKAQFTPATNFSGAASFDYTATDASGQTTSAAATITVTPLTVNDATSTPANTATTIDVLANDGGSGLTLTAVSHPANGTAAIADGVVSYTPASGFSGTDSFTYTATDAAGQQTRATVSVTVMAVAVDDSASTTAGTPIDIDALANDAGSNIAITSATAPGHGAVTIQSDGTLNYTPATGFSGTDSFRYTATQQSIRLFAVRGATPLAHSTTATVTVTVTPVGVRDTASVVAGGAVILSPLANDLGSQLSVTASTNGAYGTVLIKPGNAVQYTPRAGFSGRDAFRYTLTDASGQSTTSTVTVTVTPVAVDDSVQTVSGTAATIPALANDLGTSLALTSVTAPGHGTATIVNDAVVYTPTTLYSGPDAFSYVTTDAAGQTATANISVLVSPVAPDETATTPAGTPVTIDVLANDGGTGLSLTAVSVPSSGTATIVGSKIAYVPASGFSGRATFTYTSTDTAGDTATANVIVYVTPIAVNAATTTVAGSRVVINPTPSNTGTSLRITAVGRPTNGTAAVTTAGTVSYTPKTGFSGADAVQYWTADGTGQTTSAWVTVTVAPVAAADIRSTTVSKAVGIPVLANDSGTALTVTAHSDPTNGTVTIAPSGAAVYDPNAGFVGTDSFQYWATDAMDQVVQATVTVQVDPAVVTATHATTGVASTGHTTKVTPPDLAYTGSDPAGALYLALVLLIVGIAAWFVARNRRRSAD